MFKKNNLKVSNGCSGNITKRISRHNIDILQSSEDLPNDKKNIDIKEHCPLQGECLIENFVYWAVICSGDKETFYIHVTEGEHKSKNVNKFIIQNVRVVYTNQSLYQD